MEIRKERDRKDNRYWFFQKGELEDKFFEALEKLCNEDLKFFSSKQNEGSKTISKINGDN